MTVIEYELLREFRWAFRDRLGNDLLGDAETSSTSLRTCNVARLFS